MARPFQKIKNLNDSKSLWKIAVRVVDMWTVANSKNKQHIEMVLCDKEGDRIQVILPAEFKDQFKGRIAENTTFTLQNFEVEKNEMSIKATDHPFRLVFNGGTSVDNIDKHDIPKPSFNFKDFDEIKKGGVRPDVLIDVIGVFHELGYTQTQQGSRKIQINFWMKDLKGTLLSCTLWEDFGLQFLDFTNKAESGPTIILIHNAKIKEATEKYELGVSNAWNATKLFFNPEFPEVLEFKQGLPLDDPAFSQSQQLSLSSQIASPSSSSMTQYSSIERFIGSSVVLPLKEIMQLTETTVCVTVVKINQVKPSKNGWYYKACTKCNRAAKGDTLPLFCDQKHETNAINLRFKLEVEVEYNGVATKFFLWDRECNELLGTTAAELQRVMTEAGVTNPLEYPVHLDQLENREFVCKVKWQPTWDSCSVQAIKEDEGLVEKIKALFPKTEEDDILAVENVENAEIADTTTLSQLQTMSTIPTPRPSVIGHNETECQSSITPGKRVADELPTKDFESPDTCSTKQSSTKIRRNIKREKKD